MCRSATVSSLCTIQHKSTQQTAPIRNCFLSARFGTYPFRHSSVSHQPLCSASTAESSFRRIISSLMKTLTLKKGSAVELRASTRVGCKLHRPPRPRRTRAFPAVASSTCEAAPDRWPCKLPYRAGLTPFCKMEIACFTTSNSSTRNFCHAWNSENFVWHDSINDPKYFSSATFLASVSRFLCASKSRSSANCTFAATRSAARNFA